MNSLSLEKQKFILGVKYKNYDKTGDIKSFLQIIRAFHIPIEFERLDDYEIVTFDVKNMTIKIVDKKNNVSFVSSYRKKEGTKDCDVVLIEGSLDSRVVRKFSGVDGSIISEEVFVEDKGFEVKYKKLYAKEPVCTLEFSKIDEVSNDRFSYPLFTKQISKKWENGKYTNINDHYFTYGYNHNPYKGNDTKDETVFISDDNLVYSIEGSKQDGNYVRGMCFLNAGIPVSYQLQYVPLGLEIGYFSDLFDSNVQSSMLFDAYNGDVYGSLKVVKLKDSFEVEYEIMAGKESGVSRTYFYFPALSNGNITIDEINLLIMKLRTEYPDEIVSLICDKLSVFAEQLGISEGSIKKDDSTRLNAFYDMETDEVRDFLVENKDCYFNELKAFFTEDVKDSKIEKEKPLVLSKKNFNS